jgi:hypothetical protein
LETAQPTNVAFYEKFGFLTELWIHGNRKAACDCGHSAIPRLRR